MKSYNWKTTINNKTYNISFTKTLLKKELLVNNVPLKLKHSRTFGITRETVFHLGSSTAILVNIDNDSDLVIDGIYLTSGEKYVSVKNMPLWNLLFLGIIFIIFLLSCGNICSALFTLLGFYFVIRASIEPSLSIKKKILLCFSITLIFHLLYWCVLFILLSKL